MLKKWKASTEDSRDALYLLVFDSVLEAGNRCCFLFPWDCHILIYLLTYPHFSALAHRMLVKYLECAHPLSFPLFSPPHPCVFLLSPLFCIISHIFPCCAGPTHHNLSLFCCAIPVQASCCSWMVLQGRAYACAEAARMNRCAVLVVCCAGGVIGRMCCVLCASSFLHAQAQREHKVQHGTHSTHHTYTHPAPAATAATHTHTGSTGSTGSSAGVTGGSGGMSSSSSTGVTGATGATAGELLVSAQAQLAALDAQQDADTAGGMAAATGPAAAAAASRAQQAMQQQQAAVAAAEQQVQLQQQRLVEAGEGERQQRQLLDKVSSLAQDAKQWKEVQEQARVEGELQKQHNTLAKRWAALRGGAGRGRRVQQQLEQQE